MTSTNLYLPGFHLATLRRKPRSASQRMADEHARIRRHSISELGEHLAPLIPARDLDQDANGRFSRRRVFSRANTFWAFFSQVLDADGGCREVVRKVQAFAASRSLTMPSSSTSAYCQARSKLDESALGRLLCQTGERLEAAGQSERWNGRRVVVVDGTGVSMPDTSANQECWPQPRSQKAGCGFPQARVCACFSLQTGGLLSYRVGHHRNHELPLLRQQWGSFEAGDVFLGDKGFCSYYDVDQFQGRGVDSVVTLARRKPVKASEAKRILGPDDLLIQWPKPSWQPALSYSREEWEALPDHLTLRQIKVTVDNPGYRTKSFYLVTTLLDPATYSANDLAELYLRRWNVELFFRDIKTTLGMDILRCRTPAMVRREIQMHLIVYNSLRWLMLANRPAQGTERVSFKACLQALRNWATQLSPDPSKPRRIGGVGKALRHAIATCTNPHRPGRREPRCVKRRPKPFALLTRPRHEMTDTPHRNKYRAKPA